MKKLLFVALIAFLAVSSLFSQSAVCPQLDIIGRTSYTCTSPPCDTLSATFPDLRNTNTYVVSSIPITWYPAPASTTAISVGRDDVWSPVITLPFNFCFYGATYTQCVIGSNGIISFDVSLASGSCPWTLTGGFPPAPIPIPTSSYARASIMGPYHDIDPTAVFPRPAGEKIHWWIEGASPCRRLVVSFEEVPYFSCTSLRAYHQMVLHEGTNVIDVLISQKPVCSSWNSGLAIVGLQDWARTTAIAAPGRNCTSWTGINEAWRFIPNGTPLVDSICWFDASGAVISCTSTPSTVSTGVLGAKLYVCPTDSTTKYKASVYYDLCPIGSFVSSDSIVLTHTFGFTLDDSTKKLSCYGGTDGEASVWIDSGGTAPFSFVWSDGFSTGGIRTGLSAGSYTVTVTDSLGCTAIRNILIDGPEPFYVSFDSTKIHCFGVNDGSLFVDSVSGGTPGYTYNWGFSTNDSVGGLTAGAYSLIVHDTLGCADTFNINLYNPLPITLSATPGRSNCFNSDDGSVRLQVTNGNSPFQFSVDGGLFSADTFYTPLTEGTHSAIVQDTFGCLDTVAFTINEPTALAIALDTLSDVLCIGASNGYIRVIASGGTMPYTYVWSNGDVNNFADSLAAGTYYLTLTDSSNCELVDTFIINEPPAIGLSMTASRVSCKGLADAWANVVPTGGTPPYNYLWDDPLMQTSDTAYNLAAGMYHVVMTDSNGCYSTDSILITEPDSLLFTTNVIEVSCNRGNDGQILVHAFGGTLPYQYSLNGGVLGSDSLFSSLDSNTYLITVSDSNTCQNSSLTNVSHPPRILPFILSSDSVDCYGGNDGSFSVSQFNGNAPFSYSLDKVSYQSSNSFSGLSANNYMVYVTDSASCIDSTNIPIYQPDSLVWTIEVDHPRCYNSTDGEIRINLLSGGSPAYSYSINGGLTWSTSAVFSSLGSGNYDIELMDYHNCSLDSLIVLRNPVLLSGTLSHKAVSCFSGNDGWAAIAPHGGTPPYTFAWSNASTADTTYGLVSAWYYVTITDSNACTYTDSIFINQPTALASSYRSVNVTCNQGSDGQITISASGGTPSYTYSADALSYVSSNIISGLNAGPHTYYIQDANGCLDTGVAIIIEPARILPFVLDSDSASCQGVANGSVTLGSTNGIAPYQYNLNGGVWQSSVSFSGLAAGNYTAYVLDQNGCIDSVDFSIYQPVALALSFVYGNPLCYQSTDGYINLTINGGTMPYNYSIDGGTSMVATPNFVSLGSGTYNLFAQDFEGCTIDSQVTLVDPPLFTIDVSSTDLTCRYSKDGTITVITNGGTAPYTSFSIGDTNTFISQSTAWFINLLDGHYTVSAADGNGCIATNQIDIGKPQEDIFELNIDSTSCFGDDYNDGSITVIGSPYPVYYYSIDDENNFVPIETFTDLSAGVHTIYTRNNSGCLDTLTAMVEEPAPVLVYPTPLDTTVELGDAVQLFVSFTGTNNPTYLWQPSEGLSCTDCPNPIASLYHDQRYTVTVFDNDDPNRNICFGTGEVTIYILPHEDVYIPNAFTPNGDGENDKLLVYGNDVKTINFQVYDRWGEKLFESTEQVYGWDGTYKGSLVQPGVYIYKAELTYLDGVKDMRTGSVTVIR